jgi:hypothetical protein
MNSQSTRLQQQAVAPFTHIFLALDLLEIDIKDEVSCSYLAIIRQNTEKLRQLIQHQQQEIKLEQNMSRSPAGSFPGN